MVSNVSGAFPASETANAGVCTLGNVGSAPALAAFASDAFDSPVSEVLTCTSVGAGCRVAEIQTTGEAASGREAVL